MSTPTTPEAQGTSTRPYLIRALHDWCTDNGFTPYLAVYVDAHVQVPVEYVKNNEIVLNVSFEATSGLSLGNEAIEFKARFGGVARHIVVPIDHVIAIYARENGQGMAFPVPSDAPSAGEAGSSAVGEAGNPPLRLASTPVTQSADLDDDEEPPPDDKPPAPGNGSHAGNGRPALKRIK